MIDDLIANRSAFTAADVANLLSGVVKEPETFMRLFRQAMAHPDLIVLRDQAGADGTRVYSTGAQIALELDVVDRAARLALLSDRKANSIEPGREVKAAEEFGLSDTQREAIFAAAAERFSIVSGPSGAGKTRLAAALGSSHEARYWDVHRIAPTGVGADNFREACKVKEMVGTVRTLASLEYAIEQGTVELGPKSIVILDEAGQVGAESADRLLRLIEESGAKFVAFRDNDQVGPYEAGPIFQALEKRIGGIELDVSHRSQNPALIKCLDLLSNPVKNAEHRAVGLSEAGILHGGGTRKASIGLLAAAYVEDRSQSKIVLAHSRADVDALNTAIRTQLDSALPERNLDADMIAQGGALGELRLRDKIVLSKAYQTNAGWLRAGTTFEVERRTADEVILRHGEGQEAQFIKVATKDDNFEYRFGFASTVHGSKGRSIDSVHMLATPG
ncbi:MAG: AAA family ATPase, partial [Lentibacter algarum]